MWGSASLLCFFLFCLVCSALVEYKNISGKTLQESIEGEMSGDLEELLVAIGTFNSLRILLCETPHSQFLMNDILYTIYGESLHFASNTCSMACKNPFCCSCSEMREECACLLCRAPVWEHEGGLIFIFFFIASGKKNDDVHQYVLATLIMVRVVGRTSRLWTESWWVGPRSICWTSEPITRDSTSTRCTLPSR